MMFAQFFALLACASVYAGTEELYLRAVDSTVTVTQTKTIVATTTVTAHGSCPTTCADSAYTAVTLNFDDISCPSVCPFPGLVYHDFTFDGASGWQVVNVANAPNSLAVSSPPNGLVTMSSGFVDFGSKGNGFVFDVIRFEFSVFGSVNNTQAMFFMNAIQSSGNTRSYNTTVQTGINIGPYMIDLSGPNDTLNTVLDFTKLVNIEFAAYTSWDPATKTGTPATIVFDNFSLRRHVDVCNVNL